MQIFCPPPPPNPQLVPTAKWNGLTNVGGYICVKLV